MRKLKLQVQVSVDGYVARPGGEMDFLAWNMSNDLKNYITELTDSVDTILIGRKTFEGFSAYWGTVPEADEQYPFAQKMVNYRKVVLSRTLRSVNWTNSTLAEAGLEETIARLKQEPGRDLIVYGGASTVSQMIPMIDEFYLFINPTAIGQGLPIFRRDQPLKLVETRAFDCGIALLHYLRV